MPASDFGSHDPDFTGAQEDACVRIIDAVRALNTQVLRLNGTTDALNAAAERIEAVTASLDSVTEVRSIETFRFEFDPQDPNRVMPFNPGTGRFNPVAPGVAMRMEKDTLVGEFAFSRRYESGPDAVHGGMVSAFYDQLLAMAVMARGRTGPTLSLQVDFLKRTPIEQALRFEACVTEVEGDRFTATGSCYAGDTKVTQARALVLGNIELPVVDPTSG